MNEKELALRRALGIPDDAARVLVFAESSHWDPDWLYTAEEYYRRFVEHNLDLALAALLREPRRVYSVECVFFLRTYWERRPDKRDLLCRLANEGRLRLTSSGVTTADTLLPSTEAILRDLLLGQEWLRRNGVTQEPTLAYFSDSFGCSPALPSLLRAAGFERAAVTRIDGMLFPGCDLEPARNFPRPGSSAEQLLSVEKSLDFTWRDANDAQVLAHWNAFTYGQGDLLAYRGASRVYLFPLALADRSERLVARRIAQYAAQLAPYSRTPYLFCPIGFDFVAPLPDLVALLDRYNRLRYPVSGTWALNAGLDDYLALVECHQEELPVLALDPNPYWMGFYTARPALKRRCRDLVERLLWAERLALAQGAPGPAALEALDLAWWTAATANHHDFITGTSPDRVVEGEQIPWLKRAAEQVDEVLRRLTPSVESPPPAAEPPPGARPTWKQQDGLLRVETAHYVVELSAQAGGSIVRAWAGAAGDRDGAHAGSPWLAGPSNDLLSYRDSGGLWRLGHEYRGGSLRPGRRASAQHVAVQVGEREGALEVLSEVVLDGETLRRTLWFRADEPFIRGRVEGRAAPGRTLTLLFQVASLAEPLLMAQPGGVVSRPLHRIYDPTFWPLQDFAHLRFPDGRGLAFFLRDPGAVAGRPDGRVEWVALRNATRERAFGFIPLPANPATGHEREPYAFDYAFLLTAGGDWQDNGLWPIVQRLRRDHWAVSVGDREAAVTPPPGGAGNAGDSAGAGPAFARRSNAISEAGVTVEPTTVVPLALKPASRGEGVIVRLYAPAVPGSAVAVGWPGRPILRAYLCDARERDLESLPVAGGLVALRMPGTIATLRLLLRE